MKPEKIPVSNRNRMVDFLMNTSSRAIWKQKVLVPIDPLVKKKKFL